MKLGSLKRVPLREVWKNEERDFSKWLSTKEGIQLLGEAVGFDIEPIENESTVGRYYLDILAKVSGTDSTVVIENQIEDSNHDHLGKLITYAAGKNAACAIWIVKHANDEHRRAVEFLNETSKNDIGYFLLEIEAWKIGDSDPAPKFNVVESPNEWARAVAEDNSPSEVTQLYHRYWTEFCNYANSNAEFKSALNVRKPLHQNWMDFAIGNSGVWLSANVSEWHKRIRASIVVSANFDDRDQIIDNIGSLESALGCTLDIGSGKMKTIGIFHDFDVHEEAKWPEAFAWYCEILPKLKSEVLKLLK